MKYFVGQNLYQKDNNDIVTISSYYNNIVKGPQEYDITGPFGTWRLNELMLDTYYSVISKFDGVVAAIKDDIKTQEDQSHDNDRSSDGEVHATQGHDGPKRRGRRPNSEKDSAGH